MLTQSLKCWWKCLETTVSSMYRICLAVCVCGGGGESIILLIFTTYGGGGSSDSTCTYRVPCYYDVIRGPAAV